MNDGLMLYKSKKYFTKLKVSYRIIGEKTIDIIKSLTDLEYYYSLSNRKQLTFKKGESAVINNGKTSLTGLSLYVYKNCECPECGEPLNLHIGKSGKASVKCSNKKCKYSNFLDINVLKEFISENKIRCPKDEGKLKVGVGPKGIWIKCEHGHSVNIVDIM